MTGKRVPIPDQKRTYGNAQTKRENHTLPTHQRRLVCADSKDYLKDPNTLFKDD